MLILIDNYDSFTWNVAQALQEFNELKVIRNDACSPEEIFAMNPEGIILSPGPGNPDQAGICMDLILKSKGQYPILGICLGEQSIAQAFGGKIIPAAKRMHGKRSNIHNIEDSPLLEKLPDGFQAARYHSLAASCLPECLKITAECDGEIMALEHKEWPVYGVQFHPESIMTPDGPQIFKNFISICKDHKTFRP